MCAVGFVAVVVEVVVAAAEVEVSWTGEETRQ